MTHTRFNRPGLLMSALGMGRRAAGAATHGRADSAMDARRATITREQIDAIRGGLQIAMNYARGTGTDYDRHTAAAIQAIDAVEASLGTSAPIRPHPAGPAELVCGWCGTAMPPEGPPCACGSTVAVVPAVAKSWGKLGKGKGS